MEEKVRAVLMIEILGKPPKYLKKRLEEIVDKLSKEKEVNLIDKKIADPKKLEEKELFTSFVEVEIETSLKTLMLLIFGYMPSNIDIITPEKLKVQNSDLNSFLNELARKLHQYDELARSMILERQQLTKQIKEGKFKGGNSEKNNKKDKK